MHDIRIIRQNPKGFDAALASRGLPAMAQNILAIDATRRANITQAENALAMRNAASRKIAATKISGDGAEFEHLRSIIANKKQEISQLEKAAKIENNRLRNLLLSMPNIPHVDVPIGQSEAENKEIDRWGKIPEFNFAAKEHYQLAGVAANMDFKVAAKMSGARFVVLSGSIARLHRALTQFMLDIHTQHNGLTEINIPVLVRDKAMIGTGQLPKFSNDSYQTTSGHWLIPTSEVPLTNIVADQIIVENYLPRRYCAHSLCFRSEAGSAGRDTAGMLRQHQFEKVEMVSITKPEKSEAELERMTRCAQNILQRLKLPYRTVALCTGDMGFSACRTYDIEVWLPGQNCYREISSCSLCGDFQTRRINAHFKPKNAKKPQFLHSLNGSGLAVGRCLIAILENGQRQDGSIALPKALLTYLGGKTQINAEGTLI